VHLRNNLPDIISIKTFLEIDELHDLLRHVKSQNDSRDDEID
jgi:hypothetical protein